MPSDSSKWGIQARVIEVEKKWSQVYIDLLEWREQIIRGWVQPLDNEQIVIPFNVDSPMARTLCILFKQFIEDFEENTFDGDIVEYFVIKYDIFNQLMDLIEKGDFQAGVIDELLVFLTRLFRALLRNIPPAAFLNERLQRALKRLITTLGPQYDKPRDKLLGDLVEFVLLRESRTEAIFDDLQSQIAILVMHLYERKDPKGQQLLIEMVTSTSYLDTIQPDSGEVLENLALKMVFELGRCFVDDLESKENWTTRYDVICSLASGNPDRAFSFMLFNLVRKYFVDKILLEVAKASCNHKGSGVGILIDKILAAYEELSWHDLTICLFSRLLKGLRSGPCDNILVTACPQLFRLYNAIITEPSLQLILPHVSGLPWKEPYEMHSRRLSELLTEAYRIIPPLLINHHVFNRLYKTHLAIMERIIDKNYSSEVSFIVLNQDIILEKLLYHCQDEIIMNYGKQSIDDFLLQAQMISGILGLTEPKILYASLSLSEDRDQNSISFITKLQAMGGIQLDMLPIDQTFPIELEPLVERHAHLDALDWTTWQGVATIFTDPAKIKVAKRYILFHMILRFCAILQVRASKSYVQFLPS